jgi:hypothetical protein
MSASEMVYVVPRIHYNCVMGSAGTCRVRIPHDTCRELGSNIITYTTRATQVYPQNQGNYNPFERDIDAKQRPGRNLPADSQYTMVMPQRNEHPSAARVMTTEPLNDWSKGWPKTHEIWSGRAVQPTSTTTATAATMTSTANHTSTATVTATTTTTSIQQQKLQRATDPEVMGEKNINRTRRNRQQISPASIVATLPKSTSSDSVHIAQLPPPMVIDLTVDSIEDLMMADVQEQKTVSDNESSAPKDKAAMGKRKHVATGNPRGRPLRDPSKDGDGYKVQGLA